ncbi:hypothetical protein [Paraburkholderia caribensis]|uniref:hypothetical protein n=1 Tax=Paraburkholderia caribensis TaxID=75105 RepID=UPI002857C67F|nr:hypothetical protein [Paraburkholderia caribensis]MDR6384248.1 hypothetical protein [Paraburkholderia caribensis]
MHWTTGDILITAFAILIRLLLPSLIVGFIGFALAKDKGRGVVKWTIISVIPIVNLFGMIFLIGCTNLRLERKLDELLASLKPGTDPRIEPRIDWH